VTTSPTATPIRAPTTTQPNPTTARGKGEHSFHPMLSSISSTNKKTNKPSAPHYSKPLLIQFSKAKVSPKGQKLKNTHKWKIYGCK
jgi:hypothetical protein